MAEIIGCKIIAIGEANEEEVYFRPRSHLLEHGDEFVAIDPTAIGGRFHRVKLLCVKIQKRRLQFITGQQI